MRVPSLQQTGQGAVCGTKRESQMIMGGSIPVELFEETVCSKYKDDMLGFQREFMVS